MNNWKFDCQACDTKDISQASEPILKYVVDKSGRGASVQCCRSCAELLTKQEQKERAEVERARKEAEKQLAKEHLKAVEQQEMRDAERELVYPEGTPESPVAGLPD